MPATPIDNVPHPLPHRRRPPHDIIPVQQGLDAAPGLLQCQHPGRPAVTRAGATRASAPATRHRDEVRSPASACLRHPCAQLGPPADLSLLPGSTAPTHGHLAALLAGLRHRGRPPPKEIYALATRWPCADVAPSPTPRVPGGRCASRAAPASTSVQLFRLCGSVVVSCLKASCRQQQFMPRSGCAE